MNSITPSRLALGAAMAGLALAAPAGAHGIVAGGLAGGLLHPLTGLDHLVMLMAVGAAAAMVSSHLLAWALGGALVGAVLASTGATLPAAEVLAALAIAVVALLSLLAARRQQGGAGFLPASVAAPVVGLAVAVHAQLHGLEAPHDGSSLLWWTGALASSVLVAGGSFLLLRRQPTLRSGAAAALLLVGCCLTLAALIAQAQGLTA
jgi:urease accessory protein